MGTNGEIGKKINKLRTEQKLTLKNLSEATDLSIGFLSQLERGMTAVAIDTLEKIATALGVEISYFFNRTDNKQNIMEKYILKNYEKMCATADTGMIQYFLSNNLKEFSLLPRYIKLLPYKKGNKAEANAVEPHDGEEFIYVLEGILTVILKDEEYTLYPGDTVHFSAQTPHAWLNRSPRNAKLIVLNFPNQFAQMDKQQKNQDL